MSDTPIPGRECGDCAMCCKLPEIPALNKPTNTWCQHCDSHRSCSFYEHRPQPCRDFFCLFMRNANMGEEWRPSKSRLMLVPRDEGETVLVFVDPSRPDAWKKAPFLPTFQQWSATFRVIVMIDRYHYVIFPDHIADLGVVTEEESVSYYKERTATGERWTACREPAAP